ncbi:MAG: alanine racemase [Ktedonobacterales bacterium]
MIVLEDFIAATGAEVISGGSRTHLEGFAHDSRAIAPGECFVAVTGMHGNGHDFATDAIERGAGAVVVERAWLERHPAAATQLIDRARRSGVTLLAAHDSRAALCRYANFILNMWKPTVIAVTGSTGKTTTKEAIANVLALHAPTFRSWRNYNDRLGLPLSLGRLEPAHRFAVLELGADHPGEIADLCALVQPEVGVVTNLSPAHLQYFGSAQALGEELAQLPALLPLGGLAVLNADDPATRAMAKRTQAGVRLFGPLDERASPPDDHLTLRYRRRPIGTLAPPALALEDETGSRLFVFPHLHADHWAYAILAAVTVGAYFGIAREEALAALLAMQPLPGRMRWLDGVDGMVLLDDSHNATPASTAAGLLALDAIGRAQRAARIAVMGDMLRLGDREEIEHSELGSIVAERADYLVTYGVRGETIARSALAAGCPTDRVSCTQLAADTARAVRQFAARAQAEGKAAIVYLKGSEEMRMEQVAARLLAHPEQAEHVLDRQTQAWQRVVVMRPDRPTWLEIDLSTIAQNTRLVKELVGRRIAVLVSLKADAYGHGALRVARTVLHNGASWLGVATVSEAEPLRAAGITAPILVFGYTAPWQAREAVRFDLCSTIYSLEVAQALSRAACDLGRTARVHLKVDTGLARLGLRSEEIDSLVDFVEMLHTLPGLVVDGIFTHFATADSTDQTYARRQLSRFLCVLEALERRGLRPPIVHAANSAAMLTLPESRFDMVRPGVAIYGLPPGDETPLPEEFKPALSFKTQVAQVKWIPSGEGISYGATYITSRPTRIAVLPVGYADGFRRAPMNWGEVLVRGRRAPILGRVTMDQCMIDITCIADVSLGDEVVLIGRQGNDELTAAAVADRLGTNAYEVVAELLARVPRIS